MAADRGTLSCWVCSTECTGYRKLKKHYKKKHQEYDLIRCLFCKFVTVCQSDMRKHKKQEHAKDRFTCNQCPFSTKSWNKWKQHEATDHPREGQPDATADSQEASSCQHHRASRRVDNDTLVDLSPRRHITAEITDPEHILSAHSVMSVPKFELDSTDMTHLDIALNDSTVRNGSNLASPTDLPAYSSKAIIQGFGALELLPSQGDKLSSQKDKLPSRGDRLPSQGDSRTNKSLYVCELCKKQFVKNINLTYHMRTHTNDRRFQCEYCDYTCCQKTTLQQHLRGHLGIKPFKCEHCEYTTAYQSNLVFHAVTHSIVRPFSCDFCKKTFKRKDHLSIHMKRKHADMM